MGPRRVGGTEVALRIETLIKRTPMKISEPAMKQEDILVLIDDNFNPRNVCVVTGAASGIGRATAVAAAANSLTVVGLDVDEKGGAKTERMVRKIGGQMLFVKCDLTKDEDCEAAVKAAAQTGTIKFLANIAGVQHIDCIENFPMEKYDFMMRLMLRAPFFLSKLTIPYMKASSDGTGVIGNMSSIHSHICTMNKPVYNLTKFGLRALAQSISAEGDGRIRAFTISTGYVKTKLTVGQIPAQAEQRGISHDDVMNEVMLGKSRVKDMMNPIEAANTFMFGFSRHARFLVGGDLLFDGGIVLTY